MQQPHQSIDFRRASIEGLIVRPVSRFSDHRGWLIELFRHDELDSEHWPAMAYASETIPGAARGPHVHSRQSDYFAFLGPGEFRFYAWDARPESPSYACRVTVEAGQSNPCILIVPPGVVHAYRNVSAVPGLVFNAPNQLYGGPGRQEPVDEVRLEELPNSPYLLD